MTDLLCFSPPPCSPTPPPQRPSWTRYRLSESMKGLLVALLGGGVLGGFMAPFMRMANEVLGLPSLRILLYRCFLHLLFACSLHCQKALCFMPEGDHQRTLLRASINVISIGCAYTSFVVVLSRNAATVRKGSSATCLVLLVRLIKNGSLRSRAIFLLQQAMFLFMPLDRLTGTCVVAISFWALVSFLCASYAITKAHPALVCAVLHSEVVVTLAVPYYILREAGAPSDIMGAGVILSSIAIISAQNISPMPEGRKHVHKHAAPLARIPDAIHQ